MGNSADRRFRWIGLSSDGSQVVLHRYEGAFTAPAFATQQWFQANPELWRRGVVVDVETTGCNTVTDKIIEIGLRPFRFHRETGQVLTHDPGYGEFEDPGVPLSPEIVRITGITDEMVKDKRIEWAAVEQVLDSAQIVIAHNASFDRPFLDRYTAVSRTKVWACSFRQIDWTSKGFPSQKLEILAIYHGFFSDAHRALADADALLHLLALPAPEKETSYLAELLVNARRRQALILAVQSPIETKNALKGRGYRWDTQQRVWNKLVFLEECDGEVKWLTDQVYAGTFRGVVKELALCDAFKAM